MFDHEGPSNFNYMRDFTFGDFERIEIMGNIDLDLGIKYT